MTTRAGGLGVNLTAADTVIFAEPDANPFVDMHAMDRLSFVSNSHQQKINFSLIFTYAIIPFLFSPKDSSFGTN